MSVGLQKTQLSWLQGKSVPEDVDSVLLGPSKYHLLLMKTSQKNLADVTARMGLNHAVITVVNRDDLPDSGAMHYRRCLEEVRKTSPEVTLELLCSDLAGDHIALENLLTGLELEVFAHNVECVPRLDSTVRDARASFSQSIGILKKAKQLRPDILTKSSIMVGVGETDDEIIQALELLRDAEVRSDYNRTISSPKS